MRIVIVLNRPQSDGFPISLEKRRGDNTLHGGLCLHVTQTREMQLAYANELHIFLDLEVIDQI